MRFVCFEIFQYLTFSSAGMNARRLPSLPQLSRFGRSTLAPLGRNRLLPYLFKSPIWKPAHVPFCIRVDRRLATGLFAVAVADKLRQPDLTPPLPRHLDRIGRRYRLKPLVEIGAWKPRDRVPQSGSIARRSNCRERKVVPESRIDAPNWPIDHKTSAVLRLNFPGVQRGNQGRLSFKSASVGCVLAAIGLIIGFPHMQ